MQRVLIVRHAETDHNAGGRWQGHLDVPLNPAGRQQAAALAAYLPEHYDVRAVYSSDLLRAHQTAAPVAAAFGLEVQPEPRLKEINVGVFQGLTFDEIRERYPDVWANWQTGDMDYCLPRGQSRRQVQEAAHSFWQQITAQNGAGDIVLVSHGGTIRMLLLRLFPDVGQFALLNTSITLVERSGAGWLLARCAEIPHLIV